MLIIPITNNLDQSDNSDDKFSIIFTKRLDVLILFNKGSLQKGCVTHFHQVYQSLGQRRCNKTGVLLTYYGISRNYIKAAH